MPDPCGALITTRETSVSTNHYNRETLTTELNTNSRSVALDTTGKSGTLDITGASTALDTNGTSGTLDITGVSTALDTNGTSATQDITGASTTLDTNGTSGTLDTTGTPTALEPYGTFHMTSQDEASISTVNSSTVSSELDLTSTSKSHVSARSGMTQHEVHASLSPRQITLQTGEQTLGCDKMGVHYRKIDK